MLLAGVVSLAVWQVWLTVRLLEQDQSLESQRSHDRLGEIADLALAQLTGSLGDWDLGLHELNSLPPPPSIQARFPKGSTFILVSEKGITTYPDRPLLFTPIVPVAQKELPEAFDPVDELELREQQYDRCGQQQQDKCGKVHHRTGLPAGPAAVPGDRAGTEPAEAVRPRRLIIAAASRRCAASVHASKMIAATRATPA